MATNHTLPPLPYREDALEPDISKETLEYHYGKHHAKYVDTLNKLIENTPYADMSLEEIIRTADGAVFNNAAQVWNHTFYWHCLSPDGGGEPYGQIAAAIEQEFSSCKDFRHRFTKAATGLFGSGWVWLSRLPSGQLVITATQNADTPLRDGSVPLLACDVWEHAYYIDYRNSRADYLEAFWRHVDWNFANNQLVGADRNPEHGTAVNQ
ncbi:MAG: superoxide dismutase [Thiogranum sp.]